MPHDAAAMRIAVSGSHRVGKTTLVDELAALLPDHARVDEPYLQLEDEGYAFADPPSVDDFAAQLRRALADARTTPGPVLFDRCAVDVLAYLACHVDAGAFDLPAWLPRVRRAVRTLDLVVFVGIETPDRVAVSSDERALRAAVDAHLRDVLLDDALDLRIPVLEVTGTLAARAQRVMAWMKKRPRLQT